MTIKEELEILRGEPIQVFAENTMDIPCVETSDAEKLCKRPVVSVCMVTYNHELYIMQAIEGVMMQQTDFEFELVIGEDCSTDKTRDICFEYQKRYPENIRVLWCDRNLYRIPHPAGGNGERAIVHCRGEFIAFCEGDDYWIDPLKLQKQVDAMRNYPAVGLCFCGARHYDQGTGRIWSWDEKHEVPRGIIASRDFCNWHIFGRNSRRPGPETFLMTASTMVRKSYMMDAICRFDILKWRLYLGDTTLWLGVGGVSDCYYLPDEVSVYRHTPTGACSSSCGNVWYDAYLVRMYFASEMNPRKLRTWLASKACDSFRQLVIERWSRLTKEQAKVAYCMALRSERFPVFSSLRLMPARIILSLMGITKKSKVAICRFYMYFHL